VTGVSPSAPLDALALRPDFPILSRKINGHRLAYLDNAATTQKPRQVISALAGFYATMNSNIHRGIHTLAEEATAAYEGAREKTAAFVGADGAKSIVFTRNCTEAINLVRYSFAPQRISTGDEILTTIMEHHSNMVPWIQLAAERGAKLKFAGIRSDGTLDMDDFLALLGPRTKLVCFTHVSNVMGTINPVREMTAAAHRVGATVLIDAAQSVPHLPVSFKEIGADFMAFSAHKMLGPTGVGVLCARDGLLEEMPPFLTGGDMIREVTLEKASWNEVPWKFEAGTPNIAGVVAFGAAIDYLLHLGMDRVREHEEMITSYALSRISECGGIDIYGPSDTRLRGGVVAFNVPAIHPHDLATFLDQRGIAIRAGHNCAQPLMSRLGILAAARASFYVYTGRDDVDALVEGLREARRYFGR